MLLDSFDQLTHGFTPLLDGFRGQIATHAATRVTGLTVDSGRVTGVRAITEAGEQLTLTADAVVLAVPAPAAAALTAEHQPARAEQLGARAEQLGAVRYFPVAVVIAEYDRPVFDERVRALTFPPGCPLSNAGAYGVTDRHIVRYTFSGRAVRSLPAGNDDLITLAEKELGAHLDLTTPRRTGAVTARREHGLCAYSPFHSSTLTKINTLSKELAALALTGDYVRGASIEACFRAAYERMDAVIRTLTPTIP
ncbi:FAD-dependent oxidoreductase [Streptomyces lutosisoli]|uniref:FAD-dependent oxidoreductase n=1 Tax=Streptomyces lutosisoli TaxID=2665721 RepID=A0ABW2VXS3_9ACTN